MKNIMKKKMTTAEALAHLKSRGMVKKIIVVAVRSALREMRRG